MPCLLHLYRLQMWHRRTGSVLSKRCSSNSFNVRLIGEGEKISAAASETVVGLNRPCLVTSVVIPLGRPEL